MIRFPTAPAPLRPLHQWGSLEIAQWFAAAPRTGPLPEPGYHSQTLILETCRMETISRTAGPDWTDCTPCNHRRDAGMPRGLPAAARNDLTPNQRRIIQLLATLDARPMPDGTAMRMCANRRRLRASAEAMQELYSMGLVNGAGSRDAWGTGNTPATSWWWLTSGGMRIVGEDRKLA